MEHLSLKPAKIVAASFFGGMLIGAALLMLPASSVRGMSFIDALFMATSAVCVTGLSVMDIGTELTFFGQIVLLALIQAGGLGIMTLSLFFMLLLRRKTSLVSRIAVGYTPHRNTVQDALHTLLFIFLMTISFETLGTGLLFLEMREIHPPGQAFYYAVFHSISAFCNAGFSLYPDSLMRFRNTWLVPSVVLFLIIFGGLGFMVIDELRAYLISRRRGKRPKMSLQTRVCLQGTALLIVFGALVLWLLERDNTLRGLGPAQQILHSFFLSITPRTAGYNTLDTGMLTNASLLFTILLMFIGGCPGSAAGGIKVSTAAILIAIVKSNIKGAVSTSILERKIPPHVLAKALSVTAAGFIMIGAFSFFLQISETYGISDATTRGRFLDLLFEAVSAFGTVGLSTGITPKLSAPGKLIVIILMYAGRIGPLTLGLAIMAQRKHKTRFEYVEEEVIVS